MPNFPPNLLRDLILSHSTPLLIGSRSTVRDQYQRVRQAIPSIDCVYAIKANSDFELLETLALDGCGFDVASHSELLHVQTVLNQLESNKNALFPKLDESSLYQIADAAWSPSVLHSHPCKSPVDIEACYKAGIRRFVFDCESELMKLATMAPDSRLLMRIHVPNRSGLVAFSHRFGADLDTLVALAIHSKALGLKLEGIAFHIGSQALDPGDFGVALSIARQAWNQLQKAGFALTVLDIGGGFPVSYRDQKTISIEEYGCLVRQSIQEHFGDQSATFIAEPGRILCAEAVSLVVTIIGKQRRNGKQWYTVDDGRYGSFSGRYFSDTSFDFYPYRMSQGRLEPVSNSKVDSAENHSSNNKKANGSELSMIAGPSCDGGDIVAADYPLPDLEVGDMLVVPNLGAYSAVGASDFNGMPRAKRVWVD